MRDRLIELICEVEQEDNCVAHCNYPPCNKCKSIADHLLANGVIVPPCNVGQTVYRVIRLMNGEAFVKEGIVFEVSSTYENGIGKTKFYIWACGDEWDSRHYSSWCDLADFGKTVFLTREEAEAKLKGGSKE